ncbi:Ig-like domain-containing protein, partial [Acanthopleuribacter pedis]
PVAGTLPPALGEAMQRDRDHHLGHAQLSQLTIDPPVVSLIKQPQTEVTVTAAPGAPSGARARVHVRERHQQVGGTLTLPEHTLDLVLYRDPFRDNAPLQGVIPVHTRRAIQAGQTRNAHVLFTAVAYPPPGDGFGFHTDIHLDRLSIQLPGDNAHPVNAYPNDPDDLPLMHGAERVLGFQWQAGAGVPRARLQLDYPDRGAVILLRRDAPGAWRTVGSLQRDGVHWHNDTTAAELNRDGWYALVALDFPIGELSGTVRHQGTPRAVTLRSPSLPWLTRSNEDGAYRFFLPVWDQPQTIDAREPLTGLQVTRSFATIAAGTQTGIDFDLQRANLLLLEHQPAAGQVAVPTWRFIDLDFNQPLVWDKIQLAQHIRLSGPEGDIPLDFTRRFSFSSLRLRATQALRPQTTYRLSLDPALQAQSGDLLGNPAGFQFTTHARGNETPLDLDAWYLARENDDLVLHGPAAGFPNQTRLIVLNLDTAWSSSETLPAGSVRRVVDGGAGDRISIELATPGGQRGSRVLDSVRLGENRVLLGNHPFHIPVSGTLTLAVDQVVTGSGRELAWRALDPAEHTRLQNQLPAGQRYDGPRLDGFVFESGDGQPLPQLQGRLIADLRPYTDLLEAEPSHALVLRRLLEGVRAPVDPRQPDVLADHVIAQVQDAHAVAALEQPSQGGAQKRALASLQTYAWESHSDSAYAVYNLERHAPTAFNAALFTLREDQPDTDLDDHLLMWAAPAPWNDVPRSFGQKAYRAVRQAPIYQITGSGSGAGMRFVGITDPTGTTRILTQDVGGSKPNYLAVDPVSGAFTTLVPGTVAPAVFGLQSFRAHAYLNWPDERNNAETPDQDVTIEYRVVDLKTRPGQSEPEVTVNESETARLKDLSKLQLAEGRALQVTLRAANQPFKTVHFDADDRDRVTMPPDDTGMLVRFRYENLPRDRPYLNLAVRFETTVSPAPRGLDCRVWLIGETGTVANDPSGPPRITGTLPGDRERDVPIFEPIQIAFSEPVSGISAQTITLGDSDGNRIDLDFETLAGDPIDAGDRVHEVFARPRRVLQFEKTYQLSVQRPRDQDNNPLRVFHDDGSESDRYVATFRTQVIDPDSVPQAEARQRGYAQYRNLLIQVSHRAGNRDQGEGLTIEVVDPGDTSQPWRVLERHEVLAPGAHLPKPTLVTGEALAAADGAELTAVESGDGAAVEQLPAGSVLAVVYWDQVLNLNQLLLLRWNGGGFESLGRHVIASPGFVSDLISQGPFLVFGHNGFESTGTQLGRIEVRDLRVFLKNLDDIRNRQLTRSLTRHQYTQAFNQAGISAQFFYPRGVFDLAPLVHTEPDRQVLAFTAAARTFPGIGTLQPGDNSFLPPVDTWYDQRLLFRAHYPEQPNRPIPVGAPARPGGSRLRTAVLPRLAVRDRDQPRNLDLTLFVENFGAEDEGGTAVLHFIEVPADAEAKQNPAAVLPRVTLDFDGRIGNIAADAGTGLIAVTLNTDLETGARGAHQIVLIDAKAVYAGLDRADWQRVPVDHQAPFVVGTFGAEPASAVGEALFFHEGELYWTNAKADLVRQTVVATQRRSLGWLSFNMTAWHSDAGGGDPLSHAWQRQDTVVLHAADTAAGEDPSQGVGEAVTRAFTTEVGTFQVQLFPGEALELTMGSLEPAWQQRFNFEPVNRPRVVGVNSAALAQWLQGQAAVLRERGVLGCYVDLAISINGRVRHHQRYPFAVRYTHPPTDDPYRHQGNLDLLSRNPTLFTVDDSVSARDSRIDLSTMRYHHQDLTGPVGTFGVGMRDSGALHLGLVTWFKPDNLPDTKTDERLKADQRILLSQPGLWHSEADLEDDGTTVAFRDAPLSKLTFTKPRWTFTQGETMTSSWHGSQPLPAYQPLFNRLNKTTEPDGQDSVAPKHRLIYPLMRYQAVRGIPGDLLGRVIERERRDLPWSNRFQRGDLQREVTDLPLNLTDQPADGAARRRVQRTYRPHRLGNLLEKVERGSLILTYAYDADAYLTSVTEQARDGQTRVTRYSWEDIGVEVGKVPLKRLTKVAHDLDGSAAAGGSSEFIAAAFTYQADQPLTVATRTAPFGEQTLTFTLDAGETASVAIPAADPELPTQTIHFSAATQRRLASAWQLGTFGGTLTWERRSLGSRPAYDWFLTADSFRGQSTDYDHLGRVTEQVVDQFKTTQTWHNTLHFKGVPQSISYDAGAGPVTLNFAIEDGGRKWITRDGTAKTERLFSASGVAVGGSDITGIPHGGLTSRAYYPAGGIYQTNNETLQQERLKYGVAGDILSHRLFNIWGEPVLEVSLDATTRRQFDPLGRLTNETITAPDATITRTLSYSYQNARLVVTSTDSSDGSTTTAHFDERGLLRSQVVSGGAAPGGVIMRYDTLGRLIEQEDHDDPNHRITTRYFEDSEIPTQITAPQGTQSFTVEAGDSGIVVTGMTWHPTGEQPETIPLTIDAAGRTIRTKLEGVGAVEHAYDAFGNRTAVTAQEGPLKDKVLAAWNYAAGTVTFTDHRANRTITTKAGNNTWLDTTATIAFGHGAAAGLGSDSTRAAITEYLPNRAFTVTRTTRLDGDHLVITEKNGESGIEQTQRINGLGYPVELSTGDRVTTAGNPAQNDGFPQSWDLPGDADLFLRRNAKGQIEALSQGTGQPAAQAPTTATEDRDNLTLYLGYDAQGRLQTSTDPRGLQLTRAYQGESGVINTVTAGNPNNADNLLLQTENSGSGVSSARRTQRSWLGDEVAIHRGTENPFQTDLIRNGRI